MSISGPVTPTPQPLAAQSFSPPGGAAGNSTVCKCQSSENTIQRLVTSGIRLLKNQEPGENFLIFKGQGRGCNQPPFFEYLWLWDNPKGYWLNHTQILLKYRLVFPYEKRKVDGSTHASLRSQQDLLSLPCNEVGQRRNPTASKVTGRLTRTLSKMSRGLELSNLLIYSV